MNTYKAITKPTWHKYKAVLLVLYSTCVIGKSYAALPELSEKDFNSCKLSVEYSLPEGVELDKYCSPYQGLLEVEKDNKYGFANEKGEIVVPIIYDRVYSFFDSHLARVELAGKQGFVSTSGKVEIPLIYDAGDSYERAYDTEESAINSESSESLYSPDFGSVDNFYNGLAKVSKKGKVGFINENNKTIIPFEYDSGWRFENGFADVKKNELEGVIDKKNRIIVPFKYDDIQIISDWQDETPYFVLERDNKYGVANYKGKIIVPLNFRKIGIFSNKLVNAENFDEKWGYYDAEGTIAVPFVYDYAGSLVDGLAQVQLGDKYGFIDRKGQIVIPIQYDRILGNYFVKDTIGVVMDSKAYLINKQGKKISDDYDEIGEFHGELAPITNYIGDRINDYEGSVWSGLINDKGEVVTPMSRGLLYPAKQGQYLRFDGNEPVQLISTSGEVLGVIPDFEWPSH